MRIDQRTVSSFTKYRFFLIFLFLILIGDVVNSITCCIISILLFHSIDWLSSNLVIMNSRLTIRLRRTRYNNLLKIAHLQFKLHSISSQLICLMIELSWSTFKSIIKNHWWWVKWRLSDKTIKLFEDHIDKGHLLSVKTRKYGSQCV